MSESWFASDEAWIRHVERFLDGLLGEEMMRQHKIDREAVLRVAHAEVDNANALGRSWLTHEQLAKIIDQPRKTVARARLLLVDSGFESLEPDSLRSGTVTRVLQAQPSLI